MRDYAKFGAPVWTDHWGQVWPVITSCRRLKFKYPAHAALRRHVFHRDGYKCQRCGLAALSAPEGYDGHSTLETTKRDKDGWPILLLVDHVLTLKAGGLNVIENFQTLCQTCNLKKIREDNVAARLYREARQ